MKLILSRKGFDSANGKVASPILPDGRLCWLPIPDSTSKILYAKLGCDELNLGEVVAGITGGGIRAKHGVHLDPDISPSMMPRKNGWRGLFGQAGAAQSHLSSKGVGLGDLFLFYGWFRQAEWSQGKLAFVSDAPDVHIVFGWLQVASVEPVSAFPKDYLRWAGYHPHLNRAGSENDVLYVARSRLKLDGVVHKLPGAGVFPHARPQLVLTAPGRSRSQWRLPSGLYPPEPGLALSYHSDMTRWRRGQNCTYLNSVGRGQEFVLDGDRYPAMKRWFAELFAGLSSD